MVTRRIGATENETGVVSREDIEIGNLNVIGNATRNSNNMGVVGAAAIANFNAYGIVVVTLTSATPCTFTFTAPQYPNCKIKLRIVQPHAGVGTTIVLPGTVVGTVIQPSTTLDSITDYEFEWDGTNYYILRPLASAAAVPIIFSRHQVAHGFTKPGTPLTCVAGVWDEADNTDGTKSCDGFLLSVTGADDFVVQTHGLMALTTGQWDAVAGTTGGLSTEFYALGAAGTMTSTPTGAYEQILGRAISATEFLIDRGDMVSTVSTTAIAFSATINANTDANVAAGAIVPFDTELVDTVSMFDTTTHRATIPETGVYQFGWQIYYTNSSSNTQQMATSIYKNGSRIFSGAADPFWSGLQLPNASDAIECTGTTGIASFTVGDLVDIRNAAAALNLRHYQGHCNFWMRKI